MGYNSGGNGYSDLVRDVGSRTRQSGGPEVRCRIGARDTEVLSATDGANITFTRQPRSTWGFDLRGSDGSRYSGTIPKPGVYRISLTNGIKQA